VISPVNDSEVLPPELPEVEVAWALDVVVVGCGAGVGVAAGWVSWATEEDEEDDEEEEVGCSLTAVDTGVKLVAGAALVDSGVALVEGAVEEACWASDVDEVWATELALHRPEFALRACLREIRLGTTGSAPTRGSATGAAMRADRERCRWTAWDMWGEAKAETREMKVRTTRKENMLAGGDERNEGRGESL
jgi:hypothetical protein